MQAGLDIQLGHSESWCPVSEATSKAPETKEDPWEDIEFTDTPAHLRKPESSDYITIVDTIGIHFCNITYCQCTGADDKHMQLFWSQLFSISTIKPQTAFIFRVVDDFLPDNIVCGASAMNYFSNLRWITSNGFPHLVQVHVGMHWQPSVANSNRAKDWYHELMRVARQWCLLKALKWNGYRFGHHPPSQGGLVLFCLAWPQPGINIPVTPDTDFSHWKYTWMLVMDGNFKAEHMHSQAPENDVWLMNGLGYMVGQKKYREFLSMTSYPAQECKHPYLHISDMW